MKKMETGRNLEYKHNWQKDCFYDENYDTPKKPAPSFKLIHFDRFSRSRREAHSTNDHDTDPHSSNTFFAGL